MPRGESLPAEVARLLREAGPAAAGEALVAHAEAMARSRPGDARRWGGAMASTTIKDALLAGCARWAGGVALYLAGDATRAEPALRDAAHRLSRSGRPDLADRARLLLIDLDGERMHLERARRLGKRLHERFLARGDHERAAAALINLACAEDAGDRVARARNLWRRARRGLPRGSFRRLLAEANLGNVAAMEGRYAVATETLSEIVSVAREQGMDGLALHAELNLAEVEMAIGKVDAALARWSEIIDRADGSGDAGVAVVAELDQAEAEAALGNVSSALGRIRRVAPRARDLGLGREVARGVRLEAALEAAGGRYGGWKRAQGVLRGAALAAHRDLLLVDAAQLDPTVEPGALARAARRLIRRGVANRGRVGLAWAARRYMERGDRARARKLAAEAKAGRGVSPWVVMVATHVLAGASRPAERLGHLASACRSADSLHGRLAAAADRRAFLATRGSVYVEYLEALLDRNRPADRRRALEVVNRLRSGWLLDELARRADRGDDPQVLRWQELRCRLAALLAEVEGSTEPRLRRSGLHVDGTIREVERELRSVEAGLARRWPILTPARRSYVAEDLVARLGPDDVFVEYFVDRRDLVRFVARRSGLTVSFARGGASELRALVDSMRFHVDAAAWSGGRPRVPRGAVEARLSRIGELLSVPVPASPDGRLWIAPHNGLFHIPWAAVPGPDGTMLIDGVLFTLVPGAEAAARLLGDAPVEPATAAVGGSALEALPMVVREVRELAETLGGARITEAATRQEFLDLLRHNELVHLAGHAVFLDGMPLASGLRLSDGFITVHDLAATRLAARFVSFGVCSGLRVAREGGGAHAGFLLALMAGGVRTVVGPIAPVADELAFGFGVELHRHLAVHDDPGEAYRSAVGAVRRLDPNPAIWGSFHLYGDQRKWGHA